MGFMQACCATGPWLQVVGLPSKHWACSLAAAALKHADTRGAEWCGWAEMCLCCCWLRSRLGLLSQASSLHPAGSLLRPVLEAG